jgi:hypothetical protein
MNVKKPLFLNHTVTEVIHETGRPWNQHTGADAHGQCMVKGLLCSHLLKFEFVFAAYPKHPQHSRRLHALSAEDQWRLGFGEHVIDNNVVPGLFELFLG